MQQCIHQLGNCWSFSNTQKEENLRELAAHSVWYRNGIFKIVPECLTVRKDIATYCEIFDNLIAKEAVLRVAFQAQSLICDFETALIPAVQGSLPGVQVQGCYFHFCQQVLRRWQILDCAFLPLAEVPDAVDLHCRDVAGSLAALFQYHVELDIM
ncbi:hypothetical protein T02_2983 [Trichinella nativa]|uniref:MULE transposase domain-containing protein n=1 Tax=Trichinella nativa TaxID=6335 RepID=A0A0V1KXT8_9BILA|nr:hypothetical protein T02_2983 [Trichinella nativa]